MCLVGLGVAAKAALRVSSCLALMVVRGPRRLVPEFCSSFSLLVVSLSDEVELSVSLVSSCIGSWMSGDKLRSVQEDTGKGKGRTAVVTLPDPASYITQRLARCSREGKPALIVWLQVYCLPLHMKVEFPNYHG